MRQESPLPQAAVARIARQLAAALDFAHRRGVIHHDLKPANVLFEADGNVRLADFGLACRRFGVELDDLPCSPPLGTAAYLSPARAAGEPGGQSDDVYAFGAVLYELLTGTPPYRGLSARNICRQIRSGGPRPIQEVHPAADVELARIAAQAMARLESARYASMGEVIAALDRLA